jgi:hypothetical protein
LCQLYYYILIALPRTIQKATTASNNNSLDRGRFPFCAWLCCSRSCCSSEEDGAIDKKMEEFEQRRQSNNIAAFSSYEMIGGTIKQISTVGNNESKMLIFSN